MFKMLISATALSLLLVGCSAHQNRVGDFGDTDGKLPSNLVLDRQGAWYAANVMKLDTTARIKEAEAELKQAEVERLEVEASLEPDINIDIFTEEGLRIWREIERDKMMAKLAQQNAELAKAAIEALKPQNADKSLELSVQPKSAFSEGVESVGKAVKDVADTDAAKLLSIGGMLSVLGWNDTPDVSGDGSAGGDLYAPVTTEITEETRIDYVLKGE